MGMSTHIIGFKPLDEKFHKMLAAYRACKEAGVPVPKTVSDFFKDEPPDEAGVSVHLGSEHGRCAPGVRVWQGDSGGGFEVDLRQLDPDVKILRFYNSW